MAFSAHCTQMWKLNRISRTIISKVALKCIWCCHRVQRCVTASCSEGKLCSGAWRHGQDSHVGMFSLWCDSRQYQLILGTQENQSNLRLHYLCSPLNQPNTHSRTDPHSHLLLTLGLTHNSQTLKLVLRRGCVCCLVVLDPSWVDWLDTPWSRDSGKDAALCGRLYHWGTVQGEMCGSRQQT